MWKAPRFCEGLSGRMSYENFNIIGREYSNYIVWLVFLDYMYRIPIKCEQNVSDFLNDQKRSLKGICEKFKRIIKSSVVLYD